MKKAISILLALMLILGMSVTSFAAATEDPENTDTTAVTIKKTYKLEGEGNSPEEEFTLEQVGDGVVTDGDAEEAPALGTITGTKFAPAGATADGTTQTIEVALPTYEKVGVYEYTLQEVAGKTAGVTYFDGDIKLVVTVINGEDGKIRVAGVHCEAEGDDKSDTFVNTYSAGSLKVSKKVTGNLGDKDKYFKFTVTLEGDENLDYAPTFAVSGGSYASNPTTAELGTNTFYLKDGETITIANLPYGVSYTVEEDDYSKDGYETTTNDKEEGEIEAASVEAAFTNNKGTEIDTGITLDVIPFVVLFAAAAFGIIAVLRKKNA